MQKWWIFLRERLPVPVLLLFSVGMAFSTFSMEQIPHLPATWAIGVLFPGLFLLVLRFMDEVKDFEKDKIVHPQRPLPRGLLSVQEVTWVIYLGLGLMVLLGLSAGLIYNQAVAYTYLFTTFYLWLMYKEFFIGKSLEKSPFIYACTHQIILLPLAASVRFIQRYEFDASQLFLPGTMFLGGFFTYEICRKLDPNAHPKLNTYRHHYGEKTTFLLITVTSAVNILGDVAVFGTQSLHAYALFTSVLLVPVSYLMFIRSRYKVIEALATLNLFLQIWWLFGLKLLGA